MTATLDTKIIGQRARRVEGGRKVSGTMPYAADVVVPRMLHVRLVTSPHANADIQSVDASAARQVPGVVSVYTGRDVHPDGPEPGTRADSILARDRVIYYGQPVAAVVATSEAAADDGANAVDVDYRVLDAAMDMRAAMAADAPVVRAKKRADGWNASQMQPADGKNTDTKLLPDNVTGAQRVTRGDVEAGFAQADVVVERSYSVPWVHQGYMEPHATSAMPDGFGGLTIHTCTQGQFITRDTTARVLGLRQSDVTVVGMEVGGGFGGKSSLLSPLAGWIALRQNAPVKVVLTRAQEQALANPASGAEFDVKLGATRDGKLVAVKALGIVDAGCYRGAPLGLVVPALGGWYTIPNVDVAAYEVLTNRPGTGAYRAPGVPQATFAIESAVDEIADLVGMDPLELRLKNAVVEGDSRFDGSPWPRIGMREVLEGMRAHPLWQARRNGEKGIGAAVGSWPGSSEACTAGVRVNPDGTVIVQLGMNDISGANTTMAMLAAETYGVKLEDVRIATGDTGSAPYHGESGGSKVTYTLGPAVMRAAEDARRQTIGIAATHLEAAPEDLEIVNGVVRVKGSDDRSVSVGEIATMSMNWSSDIEPVHGMGKSAITDEAPTFVGQIVRAHVDPDTGRTTLLESALVQDVGRALNPQLVEGQIIGGATQGLGWALWEDLAYDEHGQLLASTFMDYSLPTADKSPSFDIQPIEIPSAAGPYGAKGVGEPPIIPGPAAVANAVAHATGARITALPLTAPRVLEAIQNGR
jgi:CO/xanthine dehydrogenase Mo-binding subunit